MNKIDSYLEAALKLNASDLHFVSGDPVRVRVHGGLQILMEEKLETEHRLVCIAIHQKTSTTGKTKG